MQSMVFEHSSLTKDKEYKCYIEGGGLGWGQFKSRIMFFKTHQTTICKMKVQQHKLESVFYEIEGGWNRETIPNNTNFNGTKN